MAPMTQAPYPDYATTLHVRDTCLCLHSQRAARALARRFDAAFRPIGLTNGQFSLLMALNRSEPTLGSVADLLAMDRTTLTAALKPLERRGVVARRVDGKDRRSRRIGLTEAGRRLLAEAAVIWRDAHSALDAQLAAAAGPAAPQDLRDLLASVARQP